MTSELLLMRHAKSDHDDPSLSDHDRPLSGRGRRDSPRMAAWLQENDLVPDLILSSSSVRTQQTAELMMECWDETPDLEFSESLYLSSPDVILTALRDLHGSHTRVLVLAHNPGMSMLASMLSGKSLSMPTAAVAVFKLLLPAKVLDGELPEMNPFGRLEARSELELKHFVSPRILTG